MNRPPRAGWRRHLPSRPQPSPGSPPLPRRDRVRATRPGTSSRSTPSLTQGFSGTVPDRSICHPAGCPTTARRTKTVPTNPPGPSPPTPRASAVSRCLILLLDRSTRGAESIPTRQVVERRVGYKHSQWIWGGFSRGLPFFVAFCHGAPRGGRVRACQAVGKYGSSELRR